MIGQSVDLLLQRSDDSTFSRPTQKSPDDWAISRPASTMF